MYRARPLLPTGILIMSLAVVPGMAGRAASGDGETPLPVTAGQDSVSTDVQAASPEDIADERRTFEALQRYWNRDHRMHWLVRAPEQEQKRWLDDARVVSDRYQALRDSPASPDQSVQAHFRQAFRQHDIDGDPDDYRIFLDQVVEVGDIRIPVTHQLSLANACLSMGAGMDVSQATVKHAEQAVPDAHQRLILDLLAEPSCRLSMADRLERFKTQRSGLQDGYVALIEAEFRKAVLEAKLKGHLTGGREASIKGLDIVLEAMNDSASVQSGTLTLSTGPGGESVVLPQWLVFLRSDAQGNEDGVVLYRPGSGRSLFDDRQNFFQYLDIRRLGQAVAGERSSLCAASPSPAPAGDNRSPSLRQVALAASAAGRETVVAQFFEDICKTPTSWGDHLQFHRLRDNLRTWAEGKIDLMLAGLEQLSKVPELPVLLARYNAVAAKNRAFNERHLPTLREFTRRKEREKLTAFLHKEKLVPDDREVDPDTIFIDFKGRHLKWTDWVLDGYRKHGDNFFAENTDFERDATLSSRDASIAARLNASDVKLSVMLNLRQTYAGSDYIKTVEALLDPADPRRQTSQDLRVATQILEMQLAVAIEHAKGHLDPYDYRWLKETLAALPGSIARPEVEIAEFRLAGRRISGMWVVSRKWPAGPDSKEFVRDSFIFVPEGPFGRVVHKQGAHFMNLLRTSEFKQYLADRALARDRNVIEGALGAPYSTSFSISYAPIQDFRAGCDESLRDLISDADEATTSRGEVIQEQVIKGVHFATFGICTAATGGAGAALCAIGTATLMGMDLRSAIANLQRGRDTDALWDVAFLWADAFEVGQGLKVFHPKYLLRLAQKSHFASVDEASDTIETAVRRIKGFNPDGSINAEFSQTAVTLEQLTRMPHRPGKAPAGQFYEGGGKTYIAEGGRVFEVFSDDGWVTVRVRDPARSRAFGARVVYRHGRWQRDEAGLLAGGRASSKPVRPPEPQSIAATASSDLPPERPSPLVWGEPQWGTGYLKGIEGQAHDGTIRIILEDLESTSITFDMLVCQWKTPGGRYVEYDETARTWRYIVPERSPLGGPSLPPPVADGTEMRTAMRQFGLSRNLVAWPVPVPGARTEIPRHINQIWLGDKDALLTNRTKGLSGDLLVDVMNGNASIAKRRGYKVKLHVLLDDETPEAIASLRAQLPHIEIVDLRKSNMFREFKSTRYYRAFEFFQANDRSQRNLSAASDILRNYIQYRKGGMYLDTDDALVLGFGFRPLKAKADEVLTGAVTQNPTLGMDGQFNTDVFASHPNNPFFLQLLDEQARRFDLSRDALSQRPYVVAGTIPSSSFLEYMREISRVTGPGVFNDQLRMYSHGHAVFSDAVWDRSVLQGKPKPVWLTGTNLVEGPPDSGTAEYSPLRCLVVPGNCHSWRETR